MVFSSPVFLFAFLPAVILAVYLASLLRRVQLCNLVLLVFSLVFYAYGEPKNILIMLLSIGVNYAAGLLLERFPKRKRLILSLCVAYNLGMLFVFKYLNFAVGTAGRILGRTFSFRQIALPIGISFYTFQSMSYVIDVYRGKCTAQRNPLSLALYVSLFPQLIAGPIVRYVDVEKQIGSRRMTLDGFYQGALRFAAGFSKKVLIADRLAPLVDTVFAGGLESMALHWVGAVAYALQIYFDFSGYSDMAIGLGKIFGFDFAENFDYPYTAKSIREFWRRWHISLSSWFRDYLYIPLGGSRKGRGRTYLNLLIVFAATGFWHGASFNFLFWGLFHGAFLILERVGFGKILDKLPAWLRCLYTMLIVLMGWVLFRAENMTQALAYFTGMFTPGANDLAVLNYAMDGQTWFCLIAGLLLSTPLLRKLSGLRVFRKSARIARPVCLLLIFGFAICCMVGSGYSPFLYFRF